jgi:hypothetical protein
MSDYLSDEAKKHLKECMRLDEEADSIDQNHPSNYPPKEYTNAAMEYEDIEEWVQVLGDGAVLKVRVGSSMSWIEHEETKQFMDIQHY